MKNSALVFCFILFACGTEPAENATTPAIQHEPEKAVSEPQTDISVEYQSTNQKDYNGLRQGYWIEYYGKNADRTKKAEGRYDNDQKDGEWIYYNTEGETDSVVTYDHGKWVKTEV